MSSMQVLLLGLRDPVRVLHSPEICRSVLAELLALCQHEEQRHELRNSNGFDILAEFVVSSETSLMTLDFADALLEILTTLACDRHHSVKTQLADKPPLLAFPLHCIRLYCPKKQSKKRNRAIRNALELVEHLSFTEPSRRRSHQEQVISELIRVLENPEEDAALLLVATDLLSGCVEDNRINIHTAAKFNAITTLLRLLSLSTERMGLKRAVCDALVAIAAVSELVSIIVANNAIHTLAGCLRLHVHRSVEAAAVKLLLRLCDESQVYGQVINENLIPVLFHLLERNGSLDVTRAACRILEGIAQFATSCKLDLSPFINTGLPCRGDAVAAAVATHSHEPALVGSVFRLFAHIMRNPTELTALMNSRVLEELLMLFMVDCGVVGGHEASSSTSDLADELVTIISLLSRSMIETIVLRQDDQSLPALFLCLRAHTSDLGFVANVFALVTRHWCSRNPSLRSAHVISGFVGIAIEILYHQQRQQQQQGNGHDASDSRIEMMEVYNFLREVLLTSDGSEVVLACGGAALYRSMSHRSRWPPQRAPAPAPATAARVGMGTSGNIAHPLVLCVDKMDRTITDMLGQAIDQAVSQSKTPPTCSSSSYHKLQAMRNGSENYHQFVENVLHHERNSVFRCLRGDSRRQVDVAPLADPEVEHDSILDAERETTHDEGDRADILDDGVDGVGGEKRETEDEVEEEEEEEDLNNDDGSDSDDDQGDDDEDQQPPGQNEQVDLYMGEPLSPLSADSTTPHASPPRPNHTKSPKYATLDFEKLDERPFCYVDTRSRIQYPKHPYRTAAARVSSPTGSTTRPKPSKTVDPFVLVHDPPPQLELCRLADRNAMAAAIEQAKWRRDGFVASDPTRRARLVYENTTIYEDPTERQHHASKSAMAADHEPSTSSLYEVPELSTSTASTLFPGTSSLTFDSAFESGNLARAIQIGDFEYDLVLRKDLHTSGHAQWFYFAVSNIQGTASGACPPRKYRFNIINLCKPDSLFNQGLRPVMYSVRDVHERHIGWRRAGEDIYYYANPFLRPSTKATTTATKTATSNTAFPAQVEGSGGAKTNGTASLTATAPATFFTLSFTVEFPNSDDTYLLAHSYPYTFSDHKRHLQHIIHKHRPTKRKVPQVIKHGILCSTITGRPCDLLTITEFSASTQELKCRRAVFLTARVHPGEPQASWIMRGVLDFLVSSHEVAKVLRRLFLFYVVPMLNPDGVFHGNSRCSLSACDLNRHWHAPSPTLHPTIYNIKELIKKESSTRGVVFFCDIHGHSRKKNVFMYGCDTKKRPNPLARVFAKLLAMQPSAKKFLSFPDCSFKMSKDKETTARVVLTKELQLPWCFTLEASFCGASFGELQGAHFHTTHLEQVGRALCEALLPACISDRGIRDRLVTLVDDHSVSLASYVDNHLKESGIVVDRTATAGVSTGPSSARKEKIKTTLTATTTTNKVRRRHKTESKADDDKKASTSTGSTSTGKSLQRVPSQRGAMTTTTTTTSRRKSSPAEADVTSIIGVSKSDRTASWSNSSSARLLTASGVNGLHARRSHQPTATSSPSPQCGDERRVSTRCCGVSDLLGTLEPPDEEDTQLCKLQSLVHSGRTANSPLNGTSGGSSKSVPVTPNTDASLAGGPPKPNGFCSPMAIRRRKTMPSSIPKEIATMAVATTLFGFHPVDGAAGAPFILPTPPTSELLQLRSPKPLSINLRFKGAGRQYAAVSPAATKTPAVAELMKTASTVTLVGYESDLINASAIALSQRITLTQPTTTTATPRSGDQGSSASTRKLRPANEDAAGTSFTSFPICRN